MFLVINVSRIELVMSELPPASKSERMHHSLHCDIMITFIGPDRPSAAAAAVTCRHTTKVTTTKEGSPKHCAPNTRSG
jgi:hypothetical protein